MSRNVHRKLTVSLTALLPLHLGLLACNTVDITGDGVTATPTISPNGGQFSGPVQVSLSCATPGATIRYTTDGSSPTSASPVYGGPITLSSTATIKVWASAPNRLVSSVASATFTITGPVVVPIQPNVDNTVNVPSGSSVILETAAEIGDRFIADAVPDSKDDDIRLEMISPAGAVIDTSNTGAGKPQNVIAIVFSSGTVRFNVINRSTSRTAHCRVMAQRIRASSASKLNGVYRFSTVNGQPVVGSQVEKWVFANGSLMSRYVFTDFDAILGSGGQFETWYDHSIGRVGRVQLLGATFTYSTSQNSTQVNGSNVTVSYTASGTWGDSDGTLTYSLNDDFNGVFDSSGSSLSGTRNAEISVNGGTPETFTTYLVLVRE